MTYPHEATRLNHFTQLTVQIGGILAVHPGMFPSGHLGSLNGAGFRA